MAPFLILTLVLFIAGDSVADRISGGYYVDWEAEQMNLYQAYANYDYPLNQPGLIIPGLTVQDVISVIGKAWHEREMREVFGLVCRDIAPSLTVPVGVDFISSICDPVFQSLNTNTFIDGRAICNTAYTYFGNGMPARRRRRMTEGQSLMGLDIVRNFNFEKVFNNINSRINHLHAYDQESVCTAFDRFANSEISTQRLVRDIGEIFLEEAIAQGSLICQHWDYLYDLLRQTDEQPGGHGVPDFFQTLMTDVSRLIAEFSGFDNREDLCDALVQVSPPAQEESFHDAGAEHSPSLSSLAVYIFQQMVQTVIIDDQCTQFSNDVIDVIISLSPYIDREIIDYYTQLLFDLPSVEEACTYVDSAFAFAGCDAETDTCANGGYCEDFQDIFNNSFRCYCAYGYAGTDCGIEVMVE